MRYCLQWCTHWRVIRDNYRWSIEGDIQLRVQPAHSFPVLKKRNRRMECFRLTPGTRSRRRKARLSAKLFGLLAIERVIPPRRRVDSFEIRAL
jgi:hypothetical protein